MNPVEEEDVTLPDDVDTHGGDFIDIEEAGEA